MSSTLHPGSCRRPSPSGLSEEGELLKCSHKDTKAKLETKLDVTEAEPQVSVITAVNMCFHHAAVTYLELPEMLQVGRRLVFFGMC